RDVPWPAQATGDIASAPPRRRTAPPHGPLMTSRTGSHHEHHGTRPWRRLSRLLWAIDQLGVVHRRLEHVLVGGGPLRERLLRRARAQRVDERLHLFAYLDCLPDLLREARLVWQSGEVACGGGLLDAMALGIPTVAVASDASRQLIVDAETGRLVPAEPESEFPRRALRIIEDDALAERYGAAARTRAAAEFPVERMVAGIIAALEREVDR
ncbi:MAG: glycosyltransferase, partial [Planctomycetia bacterium]